VCCRGISIEEWREPELSAQPGQGAVLVVRVTVSRYVVVFAVTFVNAQVVVPGGRLREPCA
jgi:hypothetical protein